MDTLSTVSTAIGNNPNIVVPYYSESEFSMHELLERLVEMTGPAEVKVSSFSITEVAIRTFLRLIDNHLIIGLRCIFDRSVKMHHIGLHLFALNVTTGIALTKNHAKIILIQNEQWKITVISSANLNVNDKIEAGMITGNPEIFDFYHLKFEDTFEKSIILDSDDYNP
jgi:hypothetical protein